MRNRRGFTMIEMMISITILLFVMAVTVQYMRKQTDMLTSQTARMDALQNASFAAAQIERELREAGAGVADVQPMLVQLDSEAMTFNANIVSIDTGDVRAVYRIPDANPAGVRAMYKSEALPLPNSNPATYYPDTTYLAGKGLVSGAETISYWLRSDSSSKYPNRYALFRRVNALPPTIVVRGIVKDRSDSVPMFTYYTQDTLGRPRAVPTSRYPLYHVMLHGVPADTGSSGLTDSIRIVRLHFLTAARDPRTGTDTFRTVETFVRLMNSGLLKYSSCGNPPLPPGIPTETPSAAGAAVKTVTVTWTPSIDDGGGEKDIERYAIFRKVSTDATFGDPISSIPAAAKASYAYTDAGLIPNTAYVYAVAAQDCTPKMSGLTPAAAPVTVPQ